MKIKDLFGGEIVGTGSDFIVVLKGKNRLLLQFSSHNLIKLKKDTTPYGSSIWVHFIDFQNNLNIVDKKLNLVTYKLGAIDI